jgi:1,4-alpha-glucan branching enzyme
MVSAMSDGRFRFRIYLPRASKVELVGGFTRWRAAALLMERPDPGWWEAVAELSEGEHEFCYLVDSCIWLADYAASGVKLAGHGGWVSRLVVPRSVARAAA